MKIKLFHKKSISKNAIGDKGAEKLSEKLSKMQSLNSLNLDFT
jgi:hypothetical protein